VHRYTAYGLAIHSELALPELPPGGPDADVVVRVGFMEAAPADVASEELYVRADGDVARVYLRGAGACRVRAGREVAVAPDPGGDERLLRLLVLGPALAGVLRQRGRLLFHASAVAIDGGAVAFLGGSGWGKSTVAAAFHAAGHAVVDDDVLAVGTDGAVPVTIPGVPRIKLYPDVAAHLGMDVTALPVVQPRVGKLGLAVADRFAPGPLPLRRFYVFDDADALAIVPLAPPEALVETLRHSYGARSFRALAEAEHFRQCAAVAARVSARRLRRPRLLAGLAGLVRAVEQDLAAAGAERA
jgi:hypothetical protein